MVQTAMLVVAFLATTTNVATAGTFGNAGVGHRKGVIHLASSCDPLHVVGCQGLGYNHTMVPNLLGMYDQSYSQLALTSFRPLLQYGCSPHLRIVLCGFYAPMCSPITDTPVPPCQKLCYSVRQMCSPIMSNFGYPWPLGLNCSSLPLKNTPQSMCMEGPEDASSPMSSTPTSLTAAGGGAAVCPYPQCPCRGTIPFSSQDKEFASVWMAIWSVVCCGVTLFTLASYLLSRMRYGFLEAGAFRYPDRCSVYMVGCYCLVGAGYLLRLGLGPSTGPCFEDRRALVGSNGLLDEAGANLTAPCVLVFLLLYYFTNAAAVWWVLLCGCWLAGEWRGWGHPRLLRGAAWMHLVAWGQPAVMAITVLGRRAVQPDGLTGTCYPGHGSSLTLVQWVLLPQLLLLLTGTLLLLLTFACLWRQHSALAAAQHSNNTSRSTVGPTPGCGGRQCGSRDVDTLLTGSRETTTIVSSSAATELDKLGCKQPLQSCSSGTALDAPSLTTHNKQTSAGHPAIRLSERSHCPKFSAGQCSLRAMSVHCLLKEESNETVTSSVARRPAQRAARVGIIAMLYMIPELCQVAALFYESVQRDKWLNDISQRPSIEIFMFKIFMSLAPGIMLSLFLANNRVMHSWRQLGKRLYAIHNTDVDCRAAQLALHSSGAKGYYAGDCLCEHGSGKERRLPSRVHNSTCHNCVDNEIGSVETNDMYRSVGMNAEPPGGVNGPCCSTGCDSQESGIYATSQSKQSSRDVIHNVSLDQECSEIHTPPCHHHSIEMLQSGADNRQRIDKQGPNGLYFANFNHHNFGPDYHSYNVQSPNEGSAVPPAPAHGSTTRDHHSAQGPYHVQQERRPDGLQQIHYSGSPSRKKSQKKRRKTQQRSSETRL